MSALPAGDEDPIAIQTMTVSVNTMRVGSKQVSLTMFKQLPEADIFTDGKEDTLKVQPWGIVRYFWGDQDTSGFHVVFVLSGALHRCYVPVRNEYFWEKWNTDKAIIREKRWQAIRKRRAIEYSPGFSLNALRISRKKRLDRIEDIISYEYLASARECRKRLQLNHNKAVDQLKALPQLFIAV